MSRFFSLPGKPWRKRYYGVRTRSSGDVDEGVEEGAVAGELEGLHRGRVGFVGGGILVDGGLGLRVAAAESIAC